LGVLNACASVVALEEGRRVHQQILENGYESDVFVGNSLINMYAKCGNVEDACRVFNEMLIRNVVSWTSLILGHVNCGQGQKAMELFQQMQWEGLKPDVAWKAMILGQVKCGQGRKALELFKLMQSGGMEPDVVTWVQNACASVLALEEGRCVHVQIIRSGCESDAFVGNSLVDMYAKCGSMVDAWRVFNKMTKRNVVSWTGGHVKCGQGQKALELFQQMQHERVEPDTLTFVGVLNACASVVALEEGRHVHKQIIQTGCNSDVFVSNSLIEMYAECGSLEDAWRVFI
jgi:pentatricopeptide repeat domain-containing protein 1